MWRHISQVAKIVKEETSRFWTFVSVLAAFAAFWNDFLGEQIFPKYDGFSRYWAVLPITLWVAVALYRKVVKLEVAIAPRLEILTGTGDPYELISEPLNEPGVVYRRLLRIGIRNSGNETMEGCRVELVDMPGWRNAFLPIRLKLRHDNPSDVLNIAHIQEFTISPNQVEFVDVASLNEADERSEIRLYYATQGHRNADYANLVPRGGYTLIIRAYGRVGSPAERRLKLWVDDGRLRLDIAE